MGDYKVVAHVNKDWITQFNENGTKFCFATCVEGGGSPRFNVVAFADKVSDTVTVEWTEKYSIAASTTKFADGAKFTTATKPMEIDFGSSYGVDNSWASQQPNPDSKAPKMGFLFKNETIASAVVYKNIFGKPTPVYISAGGPLPPGVEALTPKVKCKVWFSSYHVTSAMVSHFTGKAKEIDLTGKDTVEVWYTKDGLWSTTDPDAS